MACLPKASETKSGSGYSKDLKPPVILKINTYPVTKGSNNGMKREEDYTESLKYRRASNFLPHTDFIYHFCIRDMTSNLALSNVWKFRRF